MGPCPLGRSLSKCSFSGQSGGSTRPLVTGLLSWRQSVGPVDILDIAGLESHSSPTSRGCMQCSYSCPQSQPEKFQQLSLGACRPFLRSNRRPRACVHGGVWRSVPHRLTLTLPLTQAQAQAQAPHTRPLSRTHSHRLLRLTLCARAPSGQARPTQRPHVLAPHPQ